MPNTSVTQYVLQLPGFPEPVHRLCVHFCFLPSNIYRTIPCQGPLQGWNHTNEDIRLCPWPSTVDRVQKGVVYFLDQTVPYPLFCSFQSIQYLNWSDIWLLQKHTQLFTNQENKKFLLIHPIFNDPSYFYFNVSVSVCFLFL